MIARLLGPLALIAAAGVSPPVVAGGEIESAYTTFDADKCPHEEGTEEEDYGTWSCPGYQGLAVTLAAGDQRMYVSYGDWGDDDIALSQTLPGFNDAYSGTVEWRLERGRDGKLQPFATILRWNAVTASDQADDKASVTPTGRVLVVTRLGPGGVCHVGYVDARANSDANELARRIADDYARSFRCGEDKRIVLGTVSSGLGLPDDDE